MALKARVFVAVVSCLAVPSLRHEALNAQTERALDKFEVQVDVDWHGGPPGPFMLSAKAIDRASEVRRIPATSTPTSVTLAKGVWAVTLERQGFWAAQELVVANQPALLVRLGAWPVATLHGALGSIETGVDLPTVLWIGFSGSPGERSTVPAGSVACPVQAVTWSCGVPAGRLDYQISAPGFVTRYEWDRKLAAHAVHDVGTFELRRGASVVGWVEGPGNRPLEGAGISTGAREPGERSAGAERPGSVGGVGTTSNHRGFFQLIGAGPGERTLHVTHPRMIGVDVPVRLVEDTETRFPHPIVLSPPASVSVSIEPAVSPSGRSWRVELTPMLERLRGSRVRGEARKDGSWRSQGLREGRYVLKISEDDDHTWWAEEVVVSAEARNDFSVQLESLKVTGKVTLGERPLSEAKLVFGGRLGSGIWLATSTDQSGGFRIDLPRPGRWTVDLESEDPPLQRTLRAVEVESAGPGAGSAEIALPDVVVRGTVKDDLGNPRLAEVMAIPDRNYEQMAAVSSKADGTFEFHGLAEVPMQFVARTSGQLSSDVVRLTPTADAPSGPIEFVVSERLPVRGVVISTEGPVAGAKVLIFPLPFSGPTKPELTDEEGRFQTSVPKGSSGLAITVSARGYGYGISHHDVVSADPLLLVLEREKGTLRVSAPSREALFEVFVLHDRGFAGLWALRSWAIQEGQGLPSGNEVVVPGMAPGSYTACLGTRTDLQNAVRAGRPGASCATGMLADGGVLELAIAKPMSNPR